MTGTPPMGASPAGVPGGSPGNSANALASIRNAIKMLQDTLPNLPQGSPIWQGVLKNIQGLGKFAGPSDAIPGIERTNLAQIAQQARQQAPMQALMRSLGGAGTSGPSGSGSPGPGGPQLAGLTQPPGGATPRLPMPTGGAG